MTTQRTQAALFEHFQQLTCVSKYETILPDRTAQLWDRTAKLTLEDRNLATEIHQIAQGQYDFTARDSTACKDIIANCESYVSQPGMLKRSPPAVAPSSSDSDSEEEDAVVLSPDRYKAADIAGGLLRRCSNIYAVVWSPWIPYRLEGAAQERGMTCYMCPRQAALQ